MRAIIGSTPDREKVARKSETLKATTSGSSGFTAFAKISPTAISPDKRKKYNIDLDGPPLETVMKWVSPSEAVAEQICAEVIQAFGFEAPIVRSVSAVSAQASALKMKEIKPAFSPDVCQMIMMNRCKGTPLNDICSKGQIFEIDPSEWPSILEKFGQIAVVDLFLGNFDRLVRFEQSGDDSYALAVAPSVNPGNLILELSDELPRYVTRISLIDNSSLAIEKSRTDVALPLSGMATMFDSVDPKDTHSSKSPASPYSFSPEALSRFFQERIIDIQRDPTRLAEYVLTGLNRCIQELTHRDDLPAPWMNTDSLARGLVQGIAMLKNPEIQDRLQRLLDDKPSSPLKTYLQTNLSWLASFES